MPRYRFLISSAPRGVLALAVCAAMLVVGRAGAQTSGILITSPASGSVVSMGTGDAGADTPGFQTEISGSAPAGTAVEIFAKRAGGPATKAGEATSSGDVWKGPVTLGGGEWEITAAAKAPAPAAPGGPPSPPVKLFVALRYVFTWYDSVNSAGNWILIANPSKSPARAEVYVAGTKQGETLTIKPNTAAFPTFPGLLGGPVEVYSLDGVPLVVTERTTWTPDDLEEVAGVFDGQLSKRSWFSYYDSKLTQGREWILATNFGTDTANVTVKVGGTAIGSAPVAPGKSGVFFEPNVQGGPVLVESTQPMLASRRTLWTQSNFTEITSIPDRWLSRRYLFTWFDAQSTKNQDWIALANPNDGAVSVTIIPGKGARDVVTLLGAGAATLVPLPGKVGGPIEVLSTAPIVATQRSLWSGASSFEEVPGIPPPDLGTIYWQSWYDFANARDERMFQAIPPESPAEVHYSITGPTIAFDETLGPLDVRFPAFPKKIEGPLTVSADLPFLQSKRTLWGQRADFMEVNGIRGTRVEGPASPPPPPAELAVTDLPNDDGTNLVIAWTPVDDASVDGYWIYAGDDPAYRIGFASTTAGNGCPALKLCYLATGLMPGQTYDYRVVAVSAGLVEGMSAQASGKPLDDPPAPPDGLAASPGDKSVDLNWENNSEIDIKSYRVYIGQPILPLPIDLCDQPAPIGPTFKLLQNADVSEFRATGLTNGNPYCFRVTAVDAAGHEGAQSTIVGATPAAAANTPAPVPPLPVPPP